MTFEPRREPYIICILNSTSRSGILSYVTFSEFNCHEDGLKPVSDAVTHAIGSGCPRPRYLVDGKGFDFSFLDEYNVCLIH